MAMMMTPVAVVVSMMVLPIVVAVFDPYHDAVRCGVMAAPIVALATLFRTPSHRALPPRPSHFSLSKLLLLGVTHAKMVNVKLSYSFRNFGWAHKSS